MRMILRCFCATDSYTENCIKLQINAVDKNALNERDVAVANAYGNKFIIPLDFEILNSAMPYYYFRAWKRIMLRHYVQ